LASAMMDISDGLSTDLSRLSRASGVGVRIFADRIPAVAIPPSLRHLVKSDSLTLALHGGEDYGLLFTIPRRFESRIPKLLRGTRITCIGKVVRASGLQIKAADGRMSPLTPAGWDHFATR
jgi:thiamine-monophosphate kinase